MTETTEINLDITDSISTFKVIICIIILTIVLTAVFVLKFRLPIHTVTTYRSGERAVLKVREDELMDIRINDKILLLTCDFKRKAPCTVEHIGNIASDGTSDVTVLLGNFASEVWGTDSCVEKGLHVYSENRTLFNLIF